MDKAAFSLCRFGMGPRPGETLKIKQDPLGWAIAELTAKPDTKALAGLPTAQDMLKQSMQYRMLRQKEKKEGSDDEASKEIQMEQKNLIRNQVNAHLKQSATSKTPVLEKLALFWGNHFTVSATNNAVRPIVASFQREAVYPNLSGSFRDLLFAAETHPAMLVYLDNHISTGDNSRLGRRSKRGLNENLAREILELHTLGTDGGYALDDIQSLAKILSGWTVERKARRGKQGGGEAGKTTFISLMHEPGTHDLLGKTYKANGAKQLLLALNDIAYHPTTAKFIAKKLATHYISDEPDESHVDEIAATFMKTGGDLPSIHSKTFELAMEHGEPFTKARDHYSYVIALSRALGLKDRYFRMLRPVLTDMGQSPFSAPGPDGWPDRREDWITPQGLMRRISFAEKIADRSRGRWDARELMESLYGEALSDATRTHIRRAESPAQGLVLALASPEFNYV